MKRRDFFKKFGIGVAAVVAAPMIMARVMEDDQSFHFPLRIRERYSNKPIIIDHLPPGWNIPTKKEWTHIAVNGYNGSVHINGVWDRFLSADEVMEFYNHNKALSNQSICVWTKDHNKGYFGLKINQ